MRFDHSSRTFLQEHHWNWKMDCAQLMKSYQTTFISLTPLHTTYGRHVSQILTTILLITQKSFSVLDPRISYAGLKDDALQDIEDGMENLTHIDRSKESLCQYFIKKYSRNTSDATTTPSTPFESSTDGSPKRFNFTQRYRASQVGSSTDNEFDEYFSMNPVKDWDKNEPINWWASHAAQYPNLSRLARDILSIPGKPLSQLSSDYLLCYNKVLLLPLSVYFLVAETPFLCVEQV